MRKDRPKAAEWRKGAKLRPIGFASDYGAHLGCASVITVGSSVLSCLKAAA